MEKAGALKVVASGEREIMMTREFDAPREMVFDALTRPELIMRWLGPRDWPLVSCEVGLRVGGEYRFVARGPNGEEMGWGGVYREIVQPERIVTTEVFDDVWYAGEALVTAELTERGGRTTLVTTILYESREARDSVLKSPMESGVAEGYERLDELLASARSG